MTIASSQRLVVDSSVLTSLVHGKDKNHPRAREWFAGLSGGTELFMPSLALCEVTSALARNDVEKDQIDHAQALLRSWVNVLSTNDELVSEATRIARDHRVRGCDCIFVALARRERATLVTFDKDQAEKGRAVVTVDKLPSV